MCSSENELIHDVRQVHLEDMIMKNEEQFVIVRLPLSAAQRETVVAEMMFAGTPVADAFEKAILAIGTPIPPCADVETVGHVRGDCLKPGHHAAMCPPSMRDHVLIRIKHFDMALVRRTDMEAQVAKVSAEKDAEIARLKEILSLFAQYENLMKSGSDILASFAYAIFSQTVAETLNEGSAA